MVQEGGGRAARCRRVSPKATTRHLAKESVSKNAGESESDITEKDVSGLPEGALAELNVRE